MNKKTIIIASIHVYLFVAGSWISISLFREWRWSPVESRRTLVYVDAEVTFEMRNVDFADNSAWSGRFK